MNFKNDKNRRKEMISKILKEHPYIDSAYGTSALDSLTEIELYKIVNEISELEDYLGYPKKKTLLYRLKEMYPNIFKMYPDIDFRNIPEGNIERIIDGESPLELLGKPYLKFFEIELEALVTQNNLIRKEKIKYKKREGSPKTTKVFRARDHLWRSNKGYDGSYND